MLSFINKQKHKHGKANTCQFTIQFYLRKCPDKGPVTYTAFISPFIDTLWKKLKTRSLYLLQTIEKTIAMCNVSQNGVKDAVTPMGHHRGILLSHIQPCRNKSGKGDHAMHSHVRASTTAPGQTDNLLRRNAFQVLPHKLTPHADRW